jgi:hypothetical protein
MGHEQRDAVEWIEWGLFRVRGERHGKTERGRIGVGKDIRVVGVDVTEWRERKGHTLTAEMITGVYGRGLESLVIGIGVDGAIACSDAVVAAIKSHGITQVVLQRTPEACRTYSALVREGRMAALLAHGTC